MHHRTPSLLALAAAAAAFAAGCATTGATSTMPSQGPQDCDAACLAGLAESYLDAVVTQNPASASWAERVRFTEDGVPVMIGEAAWGSITAYSHSPLVVADPATGQIAWLGIVEEHGQPAYLGLRIKAEGRSIAEVETLFAREEEPTPFADTSGYPAAALAAPVPEDQRTSRRRMAQLVRAYYDTRLRDDGAVTTAFSPDCDYRVNGVSMTSGDSWSAQAAEGCQAQYEIGVWKPVDRIRDRRIVAMDAERGLVAAISFEDYAAHELAYQTTDGQTLALDSTYPNTRGLFEVFKIVDGQIARIEDVSAFLPYYMKSVWAED